MSTGHTSGQPRFLSVVHGLLTHAAERPAALVYRVIADDEQLTTATWAQFLSLTRQTASLLAEQGVSFGTRVVLPLPNSLEFLVAFFATLWLGAIAVPSPRPRRSSNTDRLLAVLGAASPEVLVCLTVDAPLFDELLAKGGGNGLRIVAFDFTTIDELAEAPLPAPLPDTEQTALIQFTSGSTSTPKGVVVSHGNLAINIEMMNRAYGMSHDTKALSWLPVFHDAGLVCMGISPAIHGGCLTLSSPQRFVRRPRSWIEDIGRFGITCTGAPNFAFDLVLNVVGQTVDLNLSTLTCLWNGAEVVSAETLRRFTKRLSASGLAATALNPAYGLAEATIGVSGGPFGCGPTVAAFDPNSLAMGRASSSDAADAVILVSAGAPGWLNDIRIVAPETRVELGEGEIGELWIAGPHVAQGYWQRPDETEAVFRARTATGEGPFLRSGDLGFRHAGRIWLAGRLKDLIIVRGRNIHPDEIELICAQALPALPLSQLVAVAVGGKTERLGLIVECPGRSADESDAMALAYRTAVSRSLDVTLSEIVFVDSGTIPRTSSGKKQRRLAARVIEQQDAKLLHRSLLAAAG